MRQFCVFYLSCMTCPSRSPRALFASSCVSLKCCLIFAEMLSYILSLNYQLELGKVTNPLPCPSHIFTRTIWWKDYENELTLNASRQNHVMSPTSESFLYYKSNTAFKVNKG